MHREVMEEVGVRVTNLRWSVSAVSLFLAVDLDLRATDLTSGNV